MSWTRPDEAALSRLTWLFGLVMLLFAAWASGRWAEQDAIRAAGRGAAVEATLRAGQLRSELERFRLLPIALSADTEVIAAVAGTAPERRRLDRRLERLAAVTGASVLYVLDGEGRAIAASNWRRADSFVGKDYRFRRYFQDARRHGSAVQFARGTVSHQPGLYFSGRARGGGYVVVKLDFDRLERSWRGAPGTSFVTDGNGIVLIASRPDIRFAATRALPEAARARFRDEMQSGSASVQPLPVLRIRGSTPLFAWRAAPRMRLAWSRVAMPAIGWRLNVLTPIDPDARNAGGTAALIVLFGGLAAGALGWAISQRQRQRRERAAAALARTAELEREVAARTGELSAQIAERVAGERRADMLREELRQANRLASLGQITAGIAHETAQPVAAIRSYAANGVTLIDRGDHRAAADNFQAIARLTERIGAVTAELRGFARKSTGTPGPLPLAEAVDGATLILRARLAQVDFAASGVAGLTVVAGKVRLEQVLVNLLQNALDALEGRADPRIRLDAHREGICVLVRVCDNGPGIAADVAARIFTPFVTSRPAGLGLGLVIAQDIMHDLGGALRLLPGEGGARFEIELVAA